MTDNRTCGMCSTPTGHILTRDGWDIRVLVNLAPPAAVTFCSPACLTEWAATVGRGLTLAQQANQGTLP